MEKNRGSDYGPNKNATNLTLTVCQNYVIRMKYNVDESSVISPINIYLIPIFIFVTTRLKYFKLSFSIM